MAQFRFHITRHSAVRAAERGWTFEDLKNVVTYANEKTRSGRGAHGGIIYRFRKTADGQTLIAVAEVRNGDCWIITGYYET